MDLRLPLDVLHLIATELADQQDFSSLYRCAISSSVFAKSGAIQNLYRICNSSPVTGGGNETAGEDSYVESESTVQRWAILWRSIILSSLGKTAYPYCQFLRVLDMRDFSFLLEDNKFRGKISGYFFSGDLAHLDMMTSTPSGRKGPRKPRLDAKSIILAVADSITRQAIKLEALTVAVSIDQDRSPADLLQLSPRMSNLQSLQLGDGRALADSKIQDLLVQSCPQLTQLEIYQWMNDDNADAALARFLRVLSPNTLTFFQNESDCGIARETCAAFGAHSQSLHSLHLAVERRGISGLGALKTCSQLRSLALTDLRPPNKLEDLPDVLADMITWLQSCVHLTSLTLSNFVSAHALLAPAMSQNNFQLEYLQVNGSLIANGLYPAREAQAFHLALANQQSLKSLLLSAEAEGTYGDDVTLICDSICSLTKLKKLNLTKTSEYFADQHVIKVCQSLTGLEDLGMDGYNITDETLSQLHLLQNLKSVSFSGVTTFSFKKLTAYIDALGPGNEALLLDLVNPAWEGSLTIKQQNQIKERLWKKVSGNFIYNVRDPADAYQYGSSSDSD